jgi:diguanylate cyclase (GGDEF)-like protein
MTEKKQSEQFIIDQIDQGIFDAIGDAISIQDTDYKILFQNSRHRDIVGDKVGEYCYRAVHGRNHVCSRCHLALVFKDGKVHTFEQSRTTDDETKYYENTGSALKDKKGNIIAGIEVVREITRRKKMEKKLRETSITDELTGLFNRRGFFTLAEQQCRLSNRSRRRMSLLYLDLDGMKTINDELGHKEGDQALIDTATILKKTFRSSDIIARIGGDEFAVLLTESHEPDMEAIIIDHVQTNLNIFNQLGGHNYELMLSMGLADYDPHNPCSVDDLLKRADELMYLDKRHHKRRNAGEPQIRSL